MPFVIGVLAIVLLILLFRVGITTEPKRLTKIARYTAIGVLGALTVFLGITERWAPAIFLAGVVWALVRGVRLWPEGIPHEHERPQPERPTSTMSRIEAFRVLGLQEGASEEDIRAAYRKLILNNHPDKGGSDYLASKINEAKDVLLR